MWADIGKAAENVAMEKGFDFLYVSCAAATSSPSLLPHVPLLPSPSLLLSDYQKAISMACLP